MPSALIKTTDLINEIHECLGQDDLDPKVKQFCDTLLFWAVVNIREPFMVLSARQVLMRERIAKEIA